MNVMSESVSMKRKSKTPHCGACGPTAIPIRIKNGMLDKPSLLARATANAISPNARPISKMMLSTDSLPATFNQQSLQSVRSEEHTSELQSPCNLVCRLLLEKKNNKE